MLRGVCSSECGSVKGQRAVKHRECEGSDNGTRTVPHGQEHGACCADAMPRAVLGLGGDLQAVSMWFLSLLSSSRAREGAALPCPGC